MKQRLLINLTVLLVTSPVSPAEEGPAFGLAVRPVASVFADQGRIAGFAASDLNRGLVGRWTDVVDPVEIPAAAAPQLGNADFSLTTWLQVPATADRPAGDLLSCYDPQTHRGFHLTLKSNPGVTSNQPNDRHLQFGIDDDRSSEWRDCGRPGNSLFSFSMAVHAGSLYAGTCEPGLRESGRVYRYAGDNRWIDCGAPDQSNAVTAMAVFQDQLYVGTGKYRVAGSSLPESENLTLGGRVFRYAGGSDWVDCGQLPGTEAVGGMVVHRDQLYCSSLYQPAGFFRYGGGTSWTSLPVPQLIDQTTQQNGPRRVVPLTVYDGKIYAGSYDGGHVFRFDGDSWTNCGQLGDNTQTYSFAQYDGKLFVGTWPSGRVYRFDAIHEWADTGRLGEELEVMGMCVHNGRLIAGTLPLAEVYSYEGDRGWQQMARLDHTPDVRYRRVWTMAEHAGQLFASTLPSGKIHACSVGRQVSWDHSLSAGWHHIAAVRTVDRLILWVDGRQVAETTPFRAAEFQLQNNRPLRLGGGVNGKSAGRMADLRIYRRALSGSEVGALSSMKPEE